MTPCGGACQRHARRDPGPTTSSLDEGHLAIALAFAVGLPAALLLLPRTARADADAGASSPDAGADSTPTEPPRALPRSPAVPDGETASPTVIIEIVVEVDGSGSAARVLDGSEPFATAALDAVRAYRSSTPLGTGRRRRAQDRRRGEARETGALTRVRLIRVVGVVGVVEKTATAKVFVIIIKYEGDVTDGEFPVVAHGTITEVERARSVFGTSVPAPVAEKSVESPETRA